MNDGLLIVGDGGQGKVVLDCAKSNGISEIAFLVDHSRKIFSGVKCFNEKCVNIAELQNEYPYLIVALGDNKMRLEKSLYYKSLGFRLKTLIHPTAFVSEFAEIGEGSVILPFSMVNSSARIGMGCIINSGAIVEHDCVLGDGVHLSPNSALGGNVKIGDRTWLCIGASVKNDVEIGNDCIIGAGAVVIGNVEKNITAVGVPAKKLEKDN